MLSSDGRAKDEASIRENLPPYAVIHETSHAQHGDMEHAIDALRKQLHRDVETHDGAGIKVEPDGPQEDRLYRLPTTGFSPVEVDLKAEERAVLVGSCGLEKGGRARDAGCGGAPSAQGTPIADCLCCAGKLLYSDLEG